MEPPTKRQKLSKEQALAIPSRTIDLNNFQRSLNRRRSGGKILLPRVPDVTVTAAVLEVAVNDGSTATQIVAPTTDIALTLGDLGTLTVPAIPAETGSDATSPGSSSGDSSGITSSTSDTISLSTNLNSTTFTTDDNTVTVTSTSTFHVSYANGTFIPATTTKTAHSTKSASDDDQDTESDSSRSSSKFNFNQLDSSTLTAGAAATGTGSYSNGNNGAAIATDTGVGAQPTSSTGPDSGTSPPILSPQQTRMVGGIVGGLAGVAMVLVALLYVLRWYRARLKKQGRLPQQLTSSHTSREFGVSGLVGCAAPMSHTRAAFLPGAAGTKKWRPGSDMTTLTNATSTTASESEKGFHRISGRKIPSVFSTGGDQFGGSYGAFEKEHGALVRTTPLIPHASDTESVHGFTPPHRPASRSTPTTPVYPTIFAGEVDAYRRPSLSSPRDFGFDELHNAFGRNMSKPDGVAVFHSSPARTPVMQSPNTSSLRLPSQAPVSMDSDIPDMPLPSPGLGPAMNYGIGIAIGTGIGERRVPSGRLSARSGTSSGRFKEDLD